MHIINFDLSSCRDFLPEDARSIYCIFEEQLKRIIKSEPHIPIIIINWNGYQDTVDCIQSVLAMQYPSFEVHLIDNNSDNCEGRRLHDLYGINRLITVHQMSENHGFAKANTMIVNQLLERDLMYVALLNNDTIVDPNWLRYLLQAAEKHAAQIVSSKLIYFDDRAIMDNAGHQMLNTGEIVPIGHAEPIETHDEPRENFGSCAAGTLYDVEMIRRIGFFDDFFSTGYEDAELGARAIVAGYRSIYAPKAIVYHKIGRSIRKVFNHQYSMMIQECIWYTYFKLMPTGVIIISLPFIVLKNILIVLVNLVFWRPTYQKILWSSLYRTFTTNWPEIKMKRRHFFDKVQCRSTLSILRKQTFFLMFDLRRFLRIFIMRKPSALDSYGKS